MAWYLVEIGGFWGVTMVFINTIIMVDEMELERDQILKVPG